MRGIRLFFIETKTNYYCNFLHKILFCNTETDSLCFCFLAVVIQSTFFSQNVYCISRHHNFIKSKINILEFTKITNISYLQLCQSKGFFLKKHNRHGHIWHVYVHTIQLLELFRVVFASIRTVIVTAGNTKLVRKSTWFKMRSENSKFFFQT